MHSEPNLAELSRSDELGRATFLPRLGVPVVGRVTVDSVPVGLDGAPRDSPSSGGATAS